MSVSGASISSKQSSSRILSPNQSLILDEIDDEDEDDFMQQRHASYGFFNRKFTRKKLKSVFPSGFTTHRVRTDRDLLPATSQFYGRNKLPYGREFDGMRAGAKSVVSDFPSKSYHDAFKGEDGFRDDMTDTMSFQAGKGDDFADVAGPYFHEVDQGATRKRQQSSMPVIPTIAAADQSDSLHKDASGPSPDHHPHRSRSPSGSPERPRTAQELMMNIDYSDVMPRGPSVGVGESHFSLSAGFGEPSGSIGSMGYLPPQQNKELVAREVHLHDRRGGRSEERTKEKSVRAKQAPIQSTAPFIPPSKLPPMPTKAAPTDHEQEMEEKSIASLESLVKQTSTPVGSRSGTVGGTGGSPSGQKRSGSPLGEPSSSSLMGSPVIDLFSQYDVLDAEGGSETWLRRGQYTAPPRERPTRRSKSPPRKSRSATGSRSGRNKKKKSAGDGNKTELGLGSPVTSPGQGTGLSEQPTVGTAETGDTLGYDQLDYDEWMKVMSEDNGSATGTAPSLVVTVKSKNTSESAAQEADTGVGAGATKTSSDGQVVKGKIPKRGNKPAGRTPLQQYLEGRLHAVRDGKVEDTSAGVEVVLYSFLSLMGGSSLDEALPSSRFSVSREIDLPTMLQLVGSVVGPAGLTSNSFYDKRNTVPEPTLFIYQEKNKSWLPLVQGIQLRLSLLSCLADRRALKLMYSLKFSDEIDEAFYYANGKPTLEEIEQAEAQRVFGIVPGSSEANKMSTPEARKFSDSLGSEDIPDMIRSMSLPPEGLSPAKELSNSRKPRSRGGGGDTATGGGTNTSASSATRTLTANNLNMKLMSYAQAQQPPKPSYGQTPFAPSSMSGKKGVAGRLKLQVNLTKRGSGVGADFVSSGRPSSYGGGDGGMARTTSLASLGVTHIPPIKRSSSSSLSAGRGPGLAENMSHEKQRMIANELQQRLLKTEWIFPS